MTPELHDRIINRLVESGESDKPWALFIVAALEGEDQLTTYLEGATNVGRPAVRSTPSAAPRVEPPGTYVSSITVEGFRGIGPSATLTLKPGPGLSLIVGRNGCGKSSFAEGLEVLLTGRNYRWEKRAKVWCEGWRNLHQRARVGLTADLLVEGQGPMSVSRAWSGEDVSKSETAVKRKGGKSQTLESMGWADALATFRPFLSYNELGSLLEDGPSKLYDALSSVLGLEELAEVQALLANARKQRQALVSNAKERADQIREAIAQLSEATSDRRLAEASLALKGPAWSLSKLDSLIRGETATDTSELDLIVRLQSLPVPDEPAIATAIERLRSTEREVAAFAGSNAERSRERARLLEQAVQFHAKHQGADCPVCGTTEVLSPGWAIATRKEVETLKKEAAAYDASEASTKAAIREAQRFISAPPPILAQAKSIGLSKIHDARKHWLVWAEGRDIDSANDLADHLENHVLELADAVRALIDEAQIERTRREDLWRPIAVAIAGWLPDAKAAVRAKEQITQLKSAEEWWKEASAAVRDERFTPIADGAVAVWNQLRLQSNVNLGGIELEGTAQRRRVALQVTVDGSPAEALGVMSQGELHSLALSLFLPRATLPESPFRFISIDDPVQSMDPARVEGLARVLADAARTRQVIVFTHDDRLPEAVRRLGIAATVLSVTRRAQSIVEVRQTLDPVRALLDDARAVAHTADLPGGVAPRVVPGFCRMAIETACMETVRRRRLLRGENHDDLEALLGSNARAHPLMALVLFDDEKKTEEVFARLKKMGPWAVETFKSCKAGAHDAYDGDVAALIKNTERLAAQLSQS
jgi:hypothetical protein